MTDQETKVKNQAPAAIIRRTGAEFGEWMGTDEFLDWLATTSGFMQTFGQFEGSDLVLEHYQDWFLRNQSRWRSVEKGRQEGFSFLFAVEALARATLRREHQSVFVSYNRDDSKEKIAYVRQLYEDLPLQFQKKLVSDSKTELVFEATEGLKTRRTRIISNPSRAPRGKKGDIYLDELAHYANDAEVYKGSTALILRSHGQLTVCSTPLGRRGKFWEVARQEQQRYPMYSRQRVPWWLCSFFLARPRDMKFRRRAALEAPSMPTGERVAKFASQDIREQFQSMLLEDFMQEYEVFYSDETLTFFPYSLILPCCLDSVVLAEEIADIVPDPDERLLSGYDVGRRKDTSDLMVVGENLKTGKKRLKLWKTYDRKPFREQEDELRGMLNSLPIFRLSIDATGLGMPLAENLTTDFPTIVESQSFSLEAKEMWAVDFKILLQNKGVELPKDRRLTQQIHSIRRAFTGHGRIQFTVEKGAKHHADAFWALALACRKDRSLVASSAPEASVNILMPGDGELAPDGPTAVDRWMAGT